MCGATGAEKSAQQQEAALSSQLSADFETVFGKTQNILDSVKGALLPIIDAGPSQNGMSAQQQAAERTMALDTTSAAGKAESQAVNESLASRGGGMGNVSSGALADVEAGIAENTENQNSKEQLGITDKGYDIGRQNFFGATSALGSDTAQLEGSALGYGNAADNAASTALGGAQTIQQADNAWEAPVAGLIGGLGGAALTGGANVAAAKIKAGQ